MSTADELARALNRERLRVIAIEGQMRRQQAVIDSLADENERLRARVATPKRKNPQGQRADMRTLVELLADVMAGRIPADTADADAERGAA